MNETCEICVKVNWEEIPKIEQIILDNLNKVGVRNISTADVFIQRQSDDLILRIDLKPFEFANTSTTKATQATILKLTNEVAMMKSVGFRQEKENKKMVKRVSVGIQTTSIPKK
ncbi:unnamed protein product [Caenorhabditis angaria]|uniref:Uncharacterized protein n=1 Tax=Caenorhabditis angaria TaxID=860376 RepID=A0A9P1N8C3_9PELO|nr:unnamed protein product [Caenorhabditis angaria]